MSYEEIIEFLKYGVKLEYLYEDTWFPLIKDSPIRIILENEIRRKI